MWSTLIVRAGEGKLMTISRYLHMQNRLPSERHPADRLGHILRQSTRVTAVETCPKHGRLPSS